jgi:hypothetical protein
MHRKITAAAVGALMAAGPGVTAAHAAAVVAVPCDTAALTAAVAAAASGATLSLAAGCVYVLRAPLPEVSRDLTIVGNKATLQRSYAPATVAFTILTVTSGTVTLSRLSFRTGRDAIAVTDNGSLTVNGGAFTGNSAANGGAISVASMYSAQVNGATFTGNTAAGSGGAIYDNSPYGIGNLTVNGGTFNRNGAADGGAIFAANLWSTQVNDARFTGNTAPAARSMTTATAMR